MNGEDPERKALDNEGDSPDILREDTRAEVVHVASDSFDPICIFEVTLQSSMILMSNFHNLFAKVEPRHLFVGAAFVWMEDAGPEPVCSPHLFH